MSDRILMNKPRGRGLVSVQESQVDEFLERKYTIVVEEVEESPIVKAIRELGPDDFTTTGKPKVEAIEDVLGHQISAKDRNDAYKVWKAADA